jgi:hypothetical protein
MAELKTQGTEIFILDDTNSGSEVEKIGQVTNIGAIGGTAGEINVTNLDSTAQEVLAGLKDNGTVSIDIDWDPQDASHVTLDSLVGGDTNKRFFIACSEADTDPTYSSTFTLPTDRTTLDFDAAVLSFQKTGGTDDVWRATLQLRISGDITITAAS